MPALIVGQRDTKVINFDNKARDIQADIREIQPNRAPFISLLQALPSRSTKSTKFEHSEHDIIEGVVQVNGAHTNVDTTIQVDQYHAARVPLNALLWNPTTEETMRVTARDLATDILTVTRDFSGSGNVAIADNEVLTIVEAYEEGVEFSEGPSNDATLDFNYVQEMETEVAMSWLQLAEAELTKADWPFQVEQKMVYHKEKKERAFLFGVRNRVATGPQGHRVFYTGGIYEKVRADGTNMKNLANTVLSKDDLDVWLSKIRSFGNPNRKLIFAAPLGWLAISRLSEGYQMIQRSEKTLGMTINKVEVNGNVYTIIENQMFVKANVENMLICVDMDNVVKRPFSWGGMNFSTKWHENVQTNSLKGKRNVLYDIEGLQISNAKAHGVLKGIKLPS